MIYKPLREHRNSPVWKFLRFSSDRGVADDLADVLLAHGTTTIRLTFRRHHRTPACTGAMIILIRLGPDLLWHNFADIVERHHKFGKLLLDIAIS